MDPAQFDALFPAKAAGAAPLAKAQPDIVGRAKQFLTAEPPPGERHGALKFGPDLGPYVRGAGRFLLPGSLEDAAGQGAMSVIPGSGVLRNLARVAAPAAAGGAVAAAKGKDPSQAALEQGAAGAVGAGAGAAVKGIARAAGAALSKTTDHVGNWIEQWAPAFKGADVRTTLRNVFSGEGSEAMRKQYAATVDTILDRDPSATVQIPALVGLGKKGSNPALPDMFFAKEAWTKIQSLERSLRGVTGDTSRRKGALEEIELLKEAQEQFRSHLNPAAIKEFDEAGRSYFQGKALQRMFGYGREKPTEARMKRLFDPDGGRLDEPTLERAFWRARGELKRAFPPEAFAQLEQTIRRGEVDPLRVSKPGQAGHIGFFGMRPHPTRLPKAPVRVGQPEVTAEQAAQFARVGGQRAGQQVLEPNQ